MEYKRSVNLKPSEQMITAMPDIVSKKIVKGDKYFLLGCDGIWELNNAETIFGMVEACKGDLRLAAERVLDKGLAPNTNLGLGCDNMSVIVVQMNRG